MCFSLAEAWIELNLDKWGCASWSLATFLTGDQRCGGGEKLVSGWWIHRWRWKLCKRTHGRPTHVLTDESLNEMSLRGMINNSFAGGVISWASHPVITSLFSSCWLLSVADQSDETWVKLISLLLGLCWQKQNMEAYFFFSFHFWLVFCTSCRRRHHISAVCVH